MPRLSSGLPKYRKHRASGQAIVTLSGRDIYLGPYGTKASKLEYDRHIAEWLAAGRQRPVEQDPVHEPTVVELLARYWTFAKRYYVKDGRPTSEQHLLRVLIRDVRALYGRHAVREFTPTCLKAVRETFIRRQLCRSTINQHMQRLVRIFSWGVEEEMVPVAVAQALREVRGLRAGRSEAPEPKPVLPIEDDIVDKTVSRLCPTVADMVRIQRLTGMRPAEVCSLRPRDIDRSGDVWLYRPASHKTIHHGRDRVVCLGPKSQAILTPYLDRSAESYCFQPREAVAEQRRAKHAARRTPLSCGNRPGSRGKVAPSRPAGERYTTCSYRRAIERAAELAGLPRWSPNRLRHTNATEVRRQFGLEAVQATLGHAQADVSQIYAERDIGLAKRVAREVG